MQVVSVADHNALIEAAYLKRGYTKAEAEAASRLASSATWHGNRTHNALKALHLDHLFGASKGGCVPGAEVKRLDTGKFSSVQRWDAQKKMGQAVAYDAMDECMRLADTHGVGIVAVDNAFHYLWGGGYVLYAAEKGYVCYTNCTSTLAEVVPFGGKTPTLGTNPHSWGFPTQDAVGFPVIVDWATSAMAMGNVQALKREGRALPSGVGVDSDGVETTDPDRVAALLPFGAHKGYGLGLIDELFGAYGGGEPADDWGRPGTGEAGEKHTCNFYFQCVKPEALECGDFACGRTQSDNVKAVLDDIMGHGNEGHAILPGQLEAKAAAESKRQGGLLFSEAELRELREVAAEVGLELPSKPAV
eukprot:CAMPEP_0206250886 /NCGR_PEP_ID=MMETSP0047_2-20121206/21720_1 /ASSEMBLY_ACC=CAM_ASM_000192 /TAXON_ID=195065 /ORGANISM="Chroomonas mesostigmatica_cf, Strain CCMP1168" /LENGTH=359 /DNA_ID=CAMNT_0053676783 /DNA_START=173 /DNA_END=1253 /DNA_ORIENTATION=+